MSVKELFNYITDITITDDNEDLYLSKMEEIVNNRLNRSNGNVHNLLSHEEFIEEQVFKNSFIPRTLDQVDNFESDAQKAKNNSNFNVKSEIF